MELIVDTREKEPWDFSIFGPVAVSRSCVKYGDYCIAGMENLLRIERKKSTGEISTNLGLKKEQFMREITWLSENIDRPILLLEFSEDDVLSFPENSNIPRRRWKYLRLSPQYLMSMLNKIREDYKIEVIFAGNRDNAEQIAYNILLEVYNANKI